MSSKNSSSEVLLPDIHFGRRLWWYSHEFVVVKTVLSYDCISRLLKNLMMALNLRRKQTVGRAMRLKVMTEMNRYLIHILMFLDEGASYLVLM